MTRRSAILVLAPRCLQAQQLPSRLLWHQFLLKVASVSASILAVLDIILLFSECCPKMKPF